MRKPLISVAFFEVGIVYKMIGIDNTVLSMMLVLLRLTLVVVLCTEALGAQDLYTLEYSDDPFTEEAWLDLRFMNEQQAGENGFIRLSTDGNGFVTGAGEAIRFWAVNGGSNASTNAFRSLDDNALAQFARFLAKKGVNMIRYHGQVFSVSADINEPNRQEIDDIWRVVAAMKKEGIYTTISPYWAGHVETIPASWGLGDYVGEVKPWALMYFEPKLRAAYKNWVQELYTMVNPYTGIALKDDAAVALIQIKNEDGVFFWTIQDVLPSLLTLMEEGFHQWLVAQYGTIAEAYNAWDQVVLDEDDPANSRMGLYIIWEATQDQTGGKNQRINDQMAYYADVQRGFYQEIYDHYRAIGCNQLINTVNWKTADPEKLFDLERWTNTVGEVMAVNRYYSPQHVGPNSGWRIEPDHLFVGESALFNPDQLPINVKQVSGKPFVTTESGWNLPHKYQAEGPFLIASYMSLTGFDSFYWFSPSSAGIDPEPYWDFANVNGQTPMFRWTVSTPGQMDMFPANALMFRKGYISKGSVTVHEERTLEAITNRELPIISEENGFDPNRDDPGLGGGGAETLVSPLAYLTGPVEVVYEGNPNATTISNSLGQLIDTENKTVTSSTQQLRWDYQNGMCTLDAPAAKGICGFPGSTTEFQLTDVTINTNDEYVVINIVSVDDESISSSEQLLVQVGTVYRPSNWSEEPASFDFGGEMVDGYRINQVGQMPWEGVRSKVSITIDNANIRSAHVLDQNGYKDYEVQVESLAGNLRRINIPGDAMYVILDSSDPGLITSVAPLIEEGIKIYPNPSNQSIQVEVTGGIDFSYLEVTDLAGRLVSRAKQNASGSYNLNLTEGVYFARVVKGREVLVTQKLVVKL